MNIYVGNLSRSATADELRRAFEDFGQVDNAHVVKDRFTGESRGFGFVEMPSREEGMSAIENLNGKEIGGHAVNVSEARPRTDREQRGGRGGGGGGGGRGGRGGGGGGGYRGGGGGGGGRRY
ncbi:MAG: RNA recognition motif domain-containing protein [Candidatus Omnitrophota bacterium]